jgi:hypothetical protein
MTDYVSPYLVHASERLKETYLGDAVYASLDGDSVKLRTSDSNRQVIWLEPAVLEALFNYVHALRGKEE